MTMTMELERRDDQDRDLASVTLEINEVRNAIANARTLAQLVESRFVEGHHFMKIPGTPRDARPHLCDPGISLISAGYRLRPEYKVLESISSDEGHFSVALECSYIHIPTGAIVAAGVGTATTNEVKYAYRWVLRGDIPLGVDPDTLATRTRRNDGAKQYRVDNQDIGDLYNTIWKMAAKRAEGDAVLKLPGCSELFAGYRIDPPRGDTPSQQRGTPAEKADVPRTVVAPKDDPQRGTKVQTYTMLQKRIEVLTANVDWERCRAWLQDQFGRDEVENGPEARAYVDWLERGMPEWRGERPSETEMRQDAEDMFGPSKPTPDPTSIGEQEPAY
jgi:hypothetical protein